MATAKLGIAFGVVRKHKVFEDIAKQIQRRIVEELKPGDSLPSERDLAHLFGVSRSSVRDAIRSLEVAGLVESRRGSGTLVREVTAESLVHPLANLFRAGQPVNELLDFRYMLEPPLARRAALHATAEQIAAMEEILRRQARRVHAGEVALEEDSEFHYSLARAANNGVMLKLLDLLMDMLRESRQALLQVEEQPRQALSAHRRILAAVKSRNPDAAEEAMRRHLRDLQEVQQGRGEVVLANRRPPGLALVSPGQA